MGLSDNLLKSLGFTLPGRAENNTQQPTSLPHLAGPLGVAMNQIRGVASNLSTGPGVPRHVTGATARMSNAAVGATSTVTVAFQRDPSDKAFSGVSVYVRGYQGNNSLVQIGGGADSPVNFILSNTGESVSIIVQAYGNSGAAPITTAPSTSIRLPKGTGGGYGTNTITQVTTSGSGLSLATSGQGWFIGPGIKDIACTIAGFNAAITNYSANVVLVQQFVLDEAWTLSKVSYKLNSGTAASHFNLGIYDASKNLVIDSGAFDGSITTVQTKSFTPTSLSPGVYYFACSATSATPTGAAIQVGAVVVGDFLKIITAVNPLIATAANATSSNVLPATLGALTAVTSATFQGLPLCAWQV